MTADHPIGTAGTVYETPRDVVHLLDEVVAAACRTRFYASLLPGRPRITTMADFLDLPVTSLSRLRVQNLADVVADPSSVKWIAGRLGGQDRRPLAVAEGPDETGRRYDLFKDALRDAAPGVRFTTATVVTTPEKRYFAAEVATVLGYTGIPTHVFIDDGSRRAYERLEQARPDLLVLVSDTVDEAALPAALKLAVTFRRSHVFQRLPQLDMYLVDELGLLAHSTDLERWVVYNDQYLFEVSEDARLIVTALRNHVQPLLRIKTDDTVADLRKYDMTLGQLSA